MFILAMELTGENQRISFKVNKPNRRKHKYGKRELRVLSKGNSMNITAKTNLSKHQKKYKHKIKKKLSKENKIRSKRHIINII